MKTKFLIIATILVVIIIVAGVFSYTYLSSPLTSPTTSHSSTATPITGSVSATLNGAGATFPQPLLSAITTQYTHNVATSVQINYQPTGSGAGIASLQNKLVDFAASDAPLSATEISNIPDTLHIPETIGAVTVAYNLPNTSSGLHLTGKVIADIFQGIITKWNDPAIQSLNANITLPGVDILVVHRSDGSGTTFIFTGYLKVSSTSWASEIGQGKSVAWPVGTGSNGNTGVASVVQGQSYSIGYIELAYALENSMSVAAVQNPSGNWILPSLASTTVAAQSAASAGLPAGNTSWTSVNILNAPDQQAYPIVSFTYLLSYKELNVIPGMTQAKATALVQFLWYVIHDGQQLAANLSYAPLPLNVVQINEATIRSITFNGQQLLN